MIRLFRAKRWVELSRQAVCESDPKKLSSILKQMNDFLKGKNAGPRNRAGSQITLLGIRPTYTERAQPNQSEVRIAARS
jgi:hypothetical protein